MNKYKKKKSNLKLLIETQMTLLEILRDNAENNESNKEIIKSMFETSKFNQDISKCDAINWDTSKWNTSNVEDMSGMFNCNQFNGDISKWNTNNITDMSNMFANANTDIDLYTSTAFDENNLSPDNDLASKIENQRSKNQNNEVSITVSNIKLTI